MPPPNPSPLASILPPQGQILIPKTLMLSCTFVRSKPSPRRSLVRSVPYSPRKSSRSTSMPGTSRNSTTLGTHRISPLLPHRQSFVRQVWGSSGSCSRRRVHQRTHRASHEFSPTPRFTNQQHPTFFPQDLPAGSDNVRRFLA